MIQEYYQCEAKRVDNGGMVRGYYVRDEFVETDFSKPEKPSEYKISHMIYVNQDDSYQVKPETVRRVAVNPIFNGSGFHFCPNCVEMHGTVSYDYLVDPSAPVCRRCGIPLDWRGITENAQ